MKLEDLEDVCYKIMLDVLGKREDDCAIQLRPVAKEVAYKFAKYIFGCQR